jgi:hypothetical protein
MLDPADKPRDDNHRVKTSAIPAETLFSYRIITQID